LHIFEVKAHKIHFCDPSSLYIQKKDLVQKTRIRHGQVFDNSRATTAVVEEDEDTTTEPLAIEGTRTGQGASSNGSASANGNADANADDGTRIVNEARRKAAESNKAGTFTQFEKDMLQLQQEQQKSQTDDQKEMVQLQREQIELTKKKSTFEEAIQKVQLAKLQAEAEAAALDTSGKLFENRERMLDRGYTLEEINSAFPLPREYLPPQP
jgi:transcription initiation factor IIF auxiliary subunit